MKINVIDLETHGMTMPCNFVHVSVDITSKFNLITLVTSTISIDLTLLLYFDL